MTMRETRLDREMRARCRGPGAGARGRGARGSKASCCCHGGPYAPEWHHGTAAVIVWLSGDLPLLQLTHML